MPFTSRARWCIVAAAAVLWRTVIQDSPVWTPRWWPQDLRLRRQVPPTRVHLAKQKYNGRNTRLRRAGGHTSHLPANRQEVNRGERGLEDAFYALGS